jgi:hypothetical protein
MECHFNKKHSHLNFLDYEQYQIPKDEIEKVVELTRKKSKTVQKSTATKRKR